MGIFDDDLGRTTTEPESTVTVQPPTQTRRSSIFDDDLGRTPIVETVQPATVSVTEDLEEVDAATSEVNYNNIRNNSAIREAAVRFAKDRLGFDDITQDDAIEEFIEHFRSFNVNEITAAYDYNYVSGAAADATGKTELRDKERNRARQRLHDYRLLYSTFTELPSFDAPGAVGDYLGGLATAPSTYAGLLLPGLGKAGGIAATNAAKAAVQGTLRQALKVPITTKIARVAAANPVKSTILVEGAAGSLQNIAQQNTEMEIDFREDYDPSETALAFGLSGAPAALGVGLLKGQTQRFMDRKTGDLLEESIKKTKEKNVKAVEKADETIKANAAEARKVKDRLDALDPEAVARGDSIMDEISFGLDLQDDMTVRLDTGKVKRVFAATVEIMKSTKKGLLKNERVTEGVARVIREKNLADPDGQAGDIFGRKIMDKYNLTTDDFADVFMADLSAAAKKLAEAGKAKMVLRRISDVSATAIFGLDEDAMKAAAKAAAKEASGDERAAVETVSKARGEVKRNMVQRLDTLRLAAMTSQSATAFRNTISGFGRIGFDVLTRAMENSIRTGVGVATGRTLKAAPNEDLFAVAFGMLRPEETMAISTIFEMGFAKRSTELFRELRDVAGTAKGEMGKMGRLEHIGRELNAINTMSDNMFKRVAFAGSLKRQLNDYYDKVLNNKEARDNYLKNSGKKGVDIRDFDLQQIMREGNFNQIFGSEQGKKLLDKAIDDALYFTYQRTPDSPTARAIINGIHKAPFLTTSLIPFPRFIMNAMRFTYEYSPLYFTNRKVLRTLIGKSDGNYEDISKAMVGTGLLFGAAAFRGSEYAGEKWYEGKLPNGETFDLRPFFPAAPFLFFGEMLNNYMENKKLPEDQKKPLFGGANPAMAAIQALTGTQFRAGFGIYALDGLFRDLTAPSDPTYEGLLGKKADVALANLGANIFSTYTIPLTAAQDMYNTFLAPDDERLVRQTRTDDVTSLIITKSLARLPGNFALEEYIAGMMGKEARELYEVPTRAEPLRRTAPITRQTAGILRQQRKNFFEEEIDRLNIPRSRITKKTGVVAADALVNKLFGEYATDYIVPILENSEYYKNASRGEQKEYVMKLINDYKQQIMKLARLESKAGKLMSGKEDFVAKRDFLGLGPEATRKAIQRYHEIHGGPPEDGKYDYSELLEYGKIADRAMN